jgi:hypothetical protein
MRDSLIAIVNNLLRHYNTVNADRQLADITKNPFKKLKIGDYPLLQNNVDSVCKQLHSIGKGGSKQQRGADAEEYKKIITAMHQHPRNSWRHQARSYLIVSSYWSGRVSEYRKLMTRWGAVAFFLQESLLRPFPLLHSPHLGHACCVHACRTPSVLPLFCPAPA